MRRWLLALSALLLLLVSCNSILGNKDHYLSADGGSDAGPLMCRLNTDCPTHNACLFQTCGPPCKGDVDCANGSRCLKTDTGTACVSSTAATCSAGCPAGTMCSSTDGVCRNACGAAECLAGQSCLAGLCVGAEQHESASAGTSGMGEGGAPEVGGAGTGAGGNTACAGAGMCGSMSGSGGASGAGASGAGASGAGASGAGASGAGASGAGAGGAGAGGAGAGGAGAGGSTAGAGGGPVMRGPGPCDIYATASTPCGAAYSMVRALSRTYTGPLYQVRNMSSSANTGTGGTTKDILMTADGYADAAMQDAFCTTTCTVSKLYDQSGNGNDLLRGPAGLAGNGTRSGFDDYESTATKLSITAGGHKVYALYMAQYEGYRTPLNVKATGIAIGNKAQGIYELADGTHAGDACCWDFGSVSPDPTKYVTMNAIFFGKGFWGKGAGTYPWFMGDFEAGVWAGGTGASTDANPMNPSMSGVDFALGILHTPVGQYALRMANLATATDLSTAYDGAIVTGKTWSNAGGIALGIESDNSNNSFGTFYEGAMTNGSPTNATDLLIMKNIQAVGYKK
ncbi:MAG: arabinofuranosidase catalytic domain-containing protein [Polyangiaceae bacterium]